MLTSERYEVSHGTDPIEYCFERGWTDGLPVVPPAEEKVAAMLAATPLTPEMILGTIPERRRSATVEKVAINAVMAGCLPVYFPVVLAAVEGLLADEFSTHGPTASTGGSGILVVVHGPAARALGVNSRNNLFGAGVRANATIGRAVRLTLMNALDTVPGKTDLSTLGHPGKYTYCIAEDEENSCWAPFHVDRGFQADEPAVTVFAAEGPRQVGNHLSRDVEPILDCLAGTMACLGLNAFGEGEFFIVLGHEHMLTIRDHGWSKKQVQQYLAQRAVQPLAALKRAGMRRGEVEPGDEARLVSAVPAADDIHLLVGGGNAGRFSAVCPAWADKRYSQAVTRPVRFK